MLISRTTAAVTQTPTINDIVANLPQELQAEFEKGYNIPDFIRLIKTSHPETTQLIQLLILLISSDRALIKEIDKAEGVPVLIDVLRRDDESEKLYAVRLLGGLATDPEVRPRIGEPECINRIAKMFFLYATSNAENTLALLMALRNIAASPRTAHEIIEQAGLIRTLIGLLDITKHDSAINENAAGVILNISTAVDHKLALANKGVIPMLLRLFESDHPEVVRMGVLALCNLAYNDKAQIQKFDDAGAVVPVVAALKHSSSRDLQEHLAQLLEFLALKFRNRVAIRDAGGIQLLVDLLSERCMMNINRGPFIAAIRNLSDESDVNKVAIREAGGIPLIISIARARDQLPPNQGNSAIALIHNMSTDVKNREIFHSDGVHSFLVDVQKAGEDDANFLLIAARTLHRLCVDENVQYDLARRQPLEILCELTQTASDEKLKEYAALSVFTLMQGKYQKEYVEVLNENNLSHMLMGTASTTENRKLREYIARILKIVADVADEANKQADNTNSPATTPA